MRNAPHEDNEDDDESAFVSMTDMMVGLLLIFIILLMYYALQAREALQKAEEVVDSANAEIAARCEILDYIQGKLAAANILAKIDDTHCGSLRLPEEAVSFELGSHILDASGRVAIHTVGDVLREVLPCFSEIKGEVDYSLWCSRLGLNIPDNIWVESVLVEGHTDCVGTLDNNWQLSSRRAASTYEALVELQDIAIDWVSRNSVQLELLNSRSNKTNGLIGVAGFADRRRLTNFETDSACVEASDENRSIDRRIEFRFAMGSCIPDGGDIARRGWVCSR